jgi:hypothetical protein
MTVSAVGGARKRTNRISCPGDFRHNVIMSKAYIAYFPTLESRTRLTTAIRSGRLRRHGYDLQRLEGLNYL